MADIAMLVAEEYERRVKSIKKAGGSEVPLPMDLISNWVSLSSQRLKLRVGAEMKEVVNYTNWIWEPRTQIGVAASSSFFSA
ncbi:uncharacterized protein G2W53_008486 [Senna tora]|uniref:Uncharacterized protein n=1 Tax=Senna tora TaxID=362788 RepID=A0A834X9K2_9FABA|nr:uncharacterized protein G2W53_008486 [Senna tora]